MFLFIEPHQFLVSSRQNWPKQEDSNPGPMDYQAAPTSPVKNLIFENLCGGLSLTYKYHFLRIYLSLSAAEKELLL